MGLKVTTWNVNGMRNPFSYEPWRRQKTFAAMFDILEADIVVMQELKIQRKDLRDDMVLVPGWDVYLSLPKHLKGYSGVAIYTRNSVCAPIRAEEGITGILTPPNSTTSFRDLPEDQQVGGYPTASQLSDFGLGAADLDCEGRCVIVEFPGMVVIGVYCPANRDESRDDFRIGFLNALDSRVRNLISMGKHVILTGDLNIIREEMDTANAEEQLKKHGMTGEEYVSTPARRMLNQLLVGGKVIGERDENKEGAVMWDICRGFHPKRKGMFTCWEQKINARPGNFGSRIDYVLCSWDCYDWFQDSNIQEGLMGSDHCPVYAVFKEKVEINGKEVDVKDILSDGMFKNGVRQREWTIKDLLPTSAKLIPEFDRRRSIRDMFSKKPSLPAGESSMTIGATPLPSGRTTPTRELPSMESVTPNGDLQPGILAPNALSTSAVLRPPPASTAARKSPPKQNGKRTLESSNSPALPQKRSKSSTSVKAAAGGKASPIKGQSSLMGFFKPKVQPATVQSDQDDNSTSFNTESDIYTADEPEASMPANPCVTKPDSFGPPLEKLAIAQNVGEDAENKPFNLADQKDVVDPIAAKASWALLGLGKRTVPLCEHEEPCKSMDTKKPGVNQGRSFYMCQRPLGPSGRKERNTQWRCGTFIWSTDWKGENA